MSEIMLPIIIVSVIGLIAGLGLAIASIVMAVPKDEKAEQIEEILPGANCGACGYSGCSGYALALSQGKAQPGLCSPGGEEVAKQTSEILGVEGAEMVKKAAVVHCNGTCENTKDSMIYQGIDSCLAASLMYGGKGECTYGCLGFGDCVKACEFGGISIVNGVSVIDMNKCKGCQACKEVCPKNLISIVEVKKQAIVRCSNHDKGAKAVKACKVSCIGCMMCVKACEFGAIKVENFVAKVDSSKCTGCGECVKVCKRNCIEIIE
ncbi:MAG: RnfABCDGE type electron transport complex subunit B [Clostridia bacterium]|nr:RnfABCDGE type electron transport complex subunit B [Clostridia bacterium]